MYIQIIKWDASTRYIRRRMIGNEQVMHHHGMHADFYILRNWSFLNSTSDNDMLPVYKGLCCLELSHWLR